MPDAGVPRPVQVGKFRSGAGVTLGLACLLCAGCFGPDDPPNEPPYFEPTTIIVNGSPYSYTEGEPIYVNEGDDLVIQLYPVDPEWDPIQCDFLTWWTGDLPSGVTYWDDVFNEVGMELYASAGRSDCGGLGMSYPLPFALLHFVLGCAGGVSPLHARSGQRTDRRFQWAPLAIFSSRNAKGSWSVKSPYM